MGAQSVNFAAKFSKNGSFGLKSCIVGEKFPTKRFFDRPKFREGTIAPAFIPPAKTLLGSTTDRNSGRLLVEFERGMQVVGCNFQTCRLLLRSSPSCRQT